MNLTRLYRSLPPVPPPSMLKSEDVDADVSGAVALAILMGAAECSVDGPRLMAPPDRGCFTGPVTVQDFDRAHRAMRASLARAQAAVEAHRWAALQAALAKTYPSAGPTDRTSPAIP